MPSVRTKLSVAGFNDAEIGEGLQDFLAEFKERPWLANPKVEWDSESKLLLVIIEGEGNDPKLEAEAILTSIAADGAIASSQVILFPSAGG